MDTTSIRAFDTAGDRSSTGHAGVEAASAQPGISATIPTMPIITNAPHKWHQEILAGLSAACVMLPISLSAGVLVYAHVGAGFLAQGAAAGLLTAVIAGVVAATLASSSFIITGPLASASIVLATLPTYLIGKEPFAHEPNLIILAIALCVFFAGLLQVIFSLFGIGRIIKFTPHSVIAGFTNSIGILIILSQLRSFISFDITAVGWISINHPTILVFILALAASIIAFASWTKTVPAPLAGLVAGTLIYYGLRSLFPNLPLGEMIGELPISFPPLSPFLDFKQGSAHAALFSVAPQLLLTSLVLATVMTLQALLAFRVAQNLADLPPRPARDLTAQGIANCASALLGGIVALAVPTVLSASFHAGGRTRFSGLTAAITIFLIAIVFSSILERIPVAVLSAILVSNGFQILDRWTLGLPGDAIFKRPAVDRRHAWENLSVVTLVMIVSVGSSVVAGAFAGFMLSCLIFIVDMARPIVRRRYLGDEIFSKRARPADDMAVLRRTGHQRVILELQGVLFFGNGDALSNIVNDILKEAKVVLLDLRGISDVDVSGASILANLMARSRARGKKILVCNVRSNRLGAIADVGSTLPDLESGLEWMEDEALQAAGTRRLGQAIPLEALELAHELDSDELAILTTLLIARDFERGAVICSEGQDADRMWLLTKGTVSVRLRWDLGHRRIAGFAAGTIFGEMALVETGRSRSATVIADEDISAYELTRTAFESILASHPKIAVKLFKYFAKEIARRLRISDSDLRQSDSVDFHKG